MNARLSLRLAMSEVDQQALIRGPHPDFQGPNMSRFYHCACTSGGDDGGGDDDVDGDDVDYDDDNDSDGDDGDVDDYNVDDDSHGDNDLQTDFSEMDLCSLTAIFSDTDAFLGASVFSETPDFSGTSFFSELSFLIPLSSQIVFSKASTFLEMEVSSETSLSSSAVFSSMEDFCETGDFSVFFPPSWFPAHQALLLQGPGTPLLLALSLPPTSDHPASWSPCFHYHPPAACCASPLRRGSHCHRPDSATSHSGLLSARKFQPPRRTLVDGVSASSSCSDRTQYSPVRNPQANQTLDLALSRLLYQLYANKGSWNTCSNGMRASL
ncbi:hypothetical protein H8959_005440 [Pygathrix nigripes]